MSDDIGNERMVRPDEIDELATAEREARKGITKVVETGNGKAVQRVMMASYPPVREHILEVVSGESADTGEDLGGDDFFVTRKMDHGLWRDKGVVWAEEDARRMGFLDEGDKAFMVIRRSGEREEDDDVVVSMVDEKKVRVSAVVNDKDGEEGARKRVDMVAEWVLGSPDKLRYTGMYEN